MEFEVALASLADLRGLRAALSGVEMVIHLASAEQEGRRGNLQAADLLGTENLARAAGEAGVERVLYVSHLGASRSSAYPVLRAKAGAEAHLRQSGLHYIILRSGLLFGPGDHFTTNLAMMLGVAPGFLPIPGDGKMLLHPLWVGDLVTCIEWLLQDPPVDSGTYEVGGPEHLSLQEVIELVSDRTGIRRALLPVRPAYMRGMMWVGERLLPRPPATTHWIDYMAMNRTAPLDSMVRLVGLQPKRMSERLGHLAGRRWGLEFLKLQFRSRTNAESD